MAVAVKKREVPDDVKVILEKCSVSGGVLMLPGQLDRAMYTRVMEVLEAFGFVWNRKAKGHVNSRMDAVQALDEMKGTGTFSKQSDYGFFASPPEVVNVLLEGIASFTNTRVLEPSAGTGNIARAAKSLGAAVDCFELQEQLAKELRDSGFRFKVFQGDFLTFAPSPVYDYVLMNPPFNGGQDVDHVMHAMKFLKPGGSLRSVMAGSVAFKDNKKIKAFYDALNKAGTYRVEKLPANSFKESGTSVATVVLRLDTFRVEKKTGMKHPSKK